MKRWGKAAVCLAGVLVLSAGTRAADSVSPNNPYVPIVVRNVFGLNPPKPEDASTTQTDPPPKITPNGIMSIFGQWQVLFKVAPKAGQPGAKEESYVLSEGQRQDDIEVIHIDEKASLVTFNNHGTVQEIPLANTPASTTPMPAPGGPGPGQLRNIPVPAGGNSGGIPPRLGGHGGGRFGAQNSGNNYNPGMGGGPAFSGQSATSQMQNKLTVEEQMVVIAAQHLKAQQEGDPVAPIFPPTPIDAEAGIIPMPGSTPR